MTDTEDMSSEVKLLLALHFSQVVRFESEVMAELTDGISPLDPAFSARGRTYGRFTTSTAAYTDVAVVVQATDSSVWVRERPLDLFDYATLGAYGFIDETDPTGEKLFATRQ